MLHARQSGGSRPTVVLVADKLAVRQRIVGGNVFQYLKAVVRGAVVHKDILHILESLLKQGPGAGRDIFLYIIYGYYD
jgi:hypothetical protein